ncbi:hypothetical protein [Microvirga vignae]|uniref:hypothetical protein n=1 Tax=Microvirga vignae TaxID=1225564 RepID=UPI000B176EA5|nr:hypothetical protein [Microvirga vignae]
MLQNIKSLLIGLCRDERSQPAAIDYGLSLAQQAQAHASIPVLSPKVTVSHAFVSQVTDRLIEEENTRLRRLAQTPRHWLIKLGRRLCPGCCLHGRSGSGALPCTLDIVREKRPRLT